VAIGKTVWYRVVTEATGVVTASTAGSTFDTVLAIYTGSSLASLHEIACNDDVSGDDTTSEVLFGAVAGETYFLQLGGFDAAAGKFELRLWLDTSRTAPPPTATRTPLPTSTIPPTATLTPTAPAATALGAVGPPALAGGVIGPAAGTTQPGVPAGQSLLTRPATVAVSALAPSIVRFVLPAGYELAISFDPAAIAALQAALPSVTQLWIVFDPQPVLLDDRQRGSLGGGNVTPAGHPFYLAIVPKDSAGMTIVPTAPAGSDDPQRRLPSDVLAKALEPVQVQLLLPVVPYPSLPGGVFAWLYSVNELGEFQGYARPAASYLPPGALLTAAMSTGGLAAGSAPPGTAGSTMAPLPPGAPMGTNPPLQPGQAGSRPPQSPPALPSVLPGQAGPLAPAVPLTSASLSPLGALSLRLPAGTLQGALFLPAVLVPAYVQNFDPEVHIYSGPGRDAIDYGLAAPQFTTFTVVGPQVGRRIFVYNPATQNYGWIDATGVGPVPGPPS